MPVVGLVAGTTATALAAGVLWMSPAQAQHYARSDPAGDMVTDNRTGVVLAPKHHNLDIRNVSVRFRPHHLTIRVTFYKLRSPRHGGGNAALVGFIRTNRWAMPYQTFRDGPWQWEVRFFRQHPYKPTMVGILDALEQEDYKCFAGLRSDQEGIRAAINYRKNFIFVSYPRRCIAGSGSHIRPRWVRVSASAFGDGYYDHWIAPNHLTYPSWSRAFYPMPRLYPG
jgi:hypothetical protein